MEVGGGVVRGDVEFAGNVGGAGHNTTLLSIIVECSTLHAHV